MKSLIILLFGCVTFSVFAENLLKNPDFSANGNYMEGWTLTTMCDQVFDLTYNEKEKFVDLESTGTEYSGYINQIVPVKPDRNYMLKVDIRLVKGRCLLWIVGLDRNKEQIGYQRPKWLSSFVGHSLVPNFIPSKYMNGSDKLEWRTEDLIFFTKKPEKSKEELAFVKVNVGVYFSTGKIQVRKIELIPLEGTKNQEVK